MSSAKVLECLSVRQCRENIEEVQGRLTGLQDQGQSNMNRVLKIARSGEIKGFSELELGDCGFMRCGKLLSLL